MKEYFITIMAVALVGGVILSLTPKGSSARYVRLLCGLCTVGCVAFPIVGFFDGELDKEGLLSVFDYEERDKEYYEEIYNNNLNKSEIENAENILKGEILEGVSAKNDDIDVRLVTEDNSGEISILKVEVTIYPSGLTIDPRRIENYVQDRLGCPCEFFYDV